MKGPTHAALLGHFGPAPPSRLPHAATPLYNSSLHKELVKLYGFILRHTQSLTTLCAPLSCHDSCHDSTQPQCTVNLTGGTALPLVNHNAHEQPKREESVVGAA